MRVKQSGNLADGEFSAQLLRIGEGTEGLDCIPIPRDMLEGCQTLDELIYSVYGDINTADSKTYQDRCILATLNESVIDINRKFNSTFQSFERSSKSIDSIIVNEIAKKVEDEDLKERILEFINSLPPSGFPVHELSLKKKAPLLLLRNLNSS